MFHRKARQQERPRAGALCACLAGCFLWAGAAAGAETAGAEALLPARPQPPTITELVPSPLGPLRPDVPVEKLRNDVTWTAWLYAASVAAQSGEKLAAGLLKEPADREAAALLASLKPLPPEAIVHDSYPDFTDVINLRASVFGDGGRTVLLMLLDNDEPRLVRVCIGATGLGTTGNLWIGGVAVQHGALVRLAKGRYPVVLETNLDAAPPRFRGLWSGSLVAPRLTEVSPEDVRAVYEWEVSRWETTMRGASDAAAPLLAAVKFDPQTIRGTVGFFRVGRSVNGFWYFIAPDGKPFVHCGMCALNQGGMGGRRMGKPPQSPEVVKEWIGIVKSWHFNALGSWTTPEFFDQGIPYVEVIEGFYVEPYLGRSFPDVFDPRWAANLDAKCKTLCTPLRESRLLIGYYLDNERGFMESLRSNETIVANSPTFVPGAGRGRRRSPDPNPNFIAAEPNLNPGQIGLLQYCLGLNTLKPPAYAKAWEFALQRRGDLAGLAKDWEVPLPSRDALAQLTQANQRLISKGYLDDEAAFVRLWVEQYYRVFTAAIRRYDPNHLTLGVRWGGAALGPAAEAEAQGADVVSQNNYRAEFYERFDLTYQLEGRPMLNGEFPGSGTDATRRLHMPIEPPGGYPDAQREGYTVREALDRVFTHPGVLGYTKYKWYGRPPELDAVRALIEANCRAALLRAEADRPPQTEHSPLTGQVFVSLQSGNVAVEELPSPQPGAPASLRVRRGELRVGLICRNGVWDRRVYGNGITGEVATSKTTGVVMELTMKVRCVPGLFTSLQGQGEYTLHLTRDGTRLEGTFEGVYNKQQTGGRAVGYVFRPVATASY